MMQKKFLIAGDSGFLRQYIVEGLLSDPENVVVDVDLLTPCNASATQFQPIESDRYERHRIAPDDPKLIGDLVTDLAPDVIINLNTANVLGKKLDPNPSQSRKSVATANLLNAVCASAQQPQLRFLQLSNLDNVDDETVEQFSVVDCESDQARSDEAIAVSPLVEQARRDCGLSVIDVVASNTFGPYQSREYFVPRAIEKLLQQQTLHVQCATRNWVFVEDAADAVIFLSKYGTSGGSYAVDSIGGRYSDLGLAELICDQLDQIMPCGHDSYRDYLVASPAVSNGDHNDTAGVRRLQEELGWKPLNDFHCALAATVRWYEEQSNWWEQSSFIADGALNHAACGSAR